MIPNLIKMPAILQPNRFLVTFFYTAWKISALLSNAAAPEAHPWFCASPQSIIQPDQAPISQPSNATAAVTAVHWAAPHCLLCIKGRTSPKAAGFKGRNHYCLQLERLWSCKDRTKWWQLSLPITYTVLNEDVVLKNIQGCISWKILPGRQ